MRKIMFLTVLLCLVVFVMPAYADKKPKDVNVVSPLPLPVTGAVNVSTVYRFVGFSKLTTRGDAGGPLGMHALCQEFGREVRMCTTEELWKSPPPPAANGEQIFAWIQPVIITTYTNNRLPPGIQTQVVDYTGLAIPINDDDFEGPAAVLSCDQWTSSEIEKRGLVVDSSNWRLFTDICAFDPGHVVTCCGPTANGP